MGEKTERATPKKRNDERRKGHVPISKEVVAVATLFMSLMLLRIQFTGIIEALKGFFGYIFLLVRVAYSEELSSELLSQSVVLVARSIGPLLLLTILAAVVATFAQTRMLVASEPIKPKFSHINPLEGFKRLFSLRSLVEVLKNIIKISILLYLIYLCLRDLVTVSAVYLTADLDGACRHLLETMFSMLLKVGGAFLVLAVIDYFYQRWEYERQMRMSKQEIKEEYKQIEGDPKVKSRIRKIQQEMAMSRMMQQVPQSDVIIRNPTHVAVALRYRYGQDDAPVVLAKGVDELAMRIVHVGEANNVTIIENVPLARALYAQAELNRPIPPDLYEAVAEVMVYLYKLGRVTA